MKTLKLWQVFKGKLYADAYKIKNDVLGEPNEDPHLMPTKLGTRAVNALTKSAEILKGVL